MPPRRRVRTSTTRDTKDANASTRRTHTPQPSTTRENSSQIPRGRAEAKGTKTNRLNSRKSSTGDTAQEKKKVSKRSGKRAAPTSEDGNAASKAKMQRLSKTQTTKKMTRPRYVDVWKEAYLAGTEWDQIKNVYRERWDFDHLDEALTDGDLIGKNVHLFGATEPQLIMMDEDDIKGEVIPVPVIVAVVSEVSPPATIGLKSVQRATEDIVPMSELRISWQPYAPPNVAFRTRYKPMVHVLKCNQRFVSLKPKGEEAIHKYDYVLPYFFYPEKEEDSNQDTAVQVLVDIDGRQAPLMCEFDYEMEDLEEAVKETIEESGLDMGKHGESLRKAIQAAVKGAKLKKKAEKAERRKRVESMPKEELEAIRNMKLIKFYPQNEWPDVSKIKSRFINRYYGQANEIR